jgi:hypothetical protein
MQTGTAKGMITMEQSLAEMIIRGVVERDVAMSRSSRPEQLAGLLERAGFGDPNAPAEDQQDQFAAPGAAPAVPAPAGGAAPGTVAPPAQDPVFGGLRVAGS